MGEQNDLPIGLFDSGMGGLTVFRALSSRLPNEDLLYLGDTARLPYGTKSANTIIRYTLVAARKLVDLGVKMIVCACNTATANALPILRETFSPLPVVGVVEPGAVAAVGKSHNGRILVIATEATIRSGVYAKALLALRADAKPSAKACPLFVPMAEEGLMEGKLVEDIAHHYLDEIFAQDTSKKPDTMILGCTHFPLLKHALENVVGDAVAVVDPAATVASSVFDTLQSRGLLSVRKRDPHYHFMTTDDVERFAAIGSLFLGHSLPLESVELIDL